MKNRNKKPHGKRPAGQSQPQGKPHMPQSPNLQKANLYGMHAVREAWLNPKRRISALYVTENALPGFKDILQEARQAGLKRPEPTMMEKHQFDRLVPQGAVHQGLAVNAQNLEDIFLSDLALSPSNDSLILMLDQVTDPHNVGAILRSASAFGAAGVVMQKKHAPVLDGVLAKTACGAVEHLPVVYETNLSRALEELKEAGYFVYGLDERGEKDIGEMKPGGKIVLVLGAEGEGMRRLVRENCDALLRLPTQGAIQSLNVSNAAAVALYALKGKS